MTKSIKLTEKSWHNLLTAIQRDYPKSVWLSRDKMRRVLGFVPREHVEWIEKSWEDILSKGWTRKIRETTIYLDFYDEGKKTFFLLKYSEYINGKER